MAETWMSTWTVIMRYPNGGTCRHDFKLSERAARYLGEDRAESDAKEFCKTFKEYATVLYCGPLQFAPVLLLLEASVSVMEHLC